MLGGVQIPLPRIKVTSDFFRALEVEGDLTADFEELEDDFVALAMADGPDGMTGHQTELNKQNQEPTLDMFFPHQVQVWSMMPNCLATMPQLLPQQQAVVKR